MIARDRPSDCCANPTSVQALPERERGRLVGLFRALGDPRRLEVFRLIAAQASPICVCDVVERFEVSQPTISHHLKVLREAGLVTVSRRGLWAYYAVDARGLERLATTLRALASAEPPTAT
ncbi:MAG: winged helix-turn-helix transcriptional regulator [Chloroflexi bacterium]|nr:winged helix-turn-helix transcriptional regulator [Chloroflexota bacterium]